MRRCFSNLTTWRWKKRTTAAFSTLLSQLNASLTALCSCASPVSVFRRCHAAYITSVAVCIGLGASTPASPWSVSFLGRDHQFSGPHDGWSECGFHVIHIAVSRQGYLEIPSNRCGLLLSRLWISHHAPAVHWRLSWGLQPADSIKLAENLDGCGYNVVVRNGKQGGLEVHRNVSYECAITLFR